MPAASLVVLIEGEVGHRVGRDELVFARSKPGLLMNPPPGAGVEVGLV